MAHHRNIRSLLLLIAIAAITSVVIACETEQVQYYLTPTQVPPGHGMTAPNATEIVAATELPRTPATATPGPKPTAHPTPAPAAEIPDGYLSDQTQAEHSALILGCTGWSSVKVDETLYYRPCADDAIWTSLNASSDELAVLSGEATATIESQPPTPSPIATPNNSLIPVPTPTRQP